MGSGERFCIDLSALDDMNVEGTEQFELYFETIDPSNYATVGDPATLCVDISDTDSEMHSSFTSTLIQ